MSDSSPIFKRRPRPQVVPETPASASSRHSSGTKVVKKKKTRKSVAKGRNQKGVHRKPKVNRRQEKLRCPLLDLQAKEEGNSGDDENSTDDRDATDDSIVASGSDHSDASYSIYAIGQSSQAEQYGFTVPLNQVRARALDRPAIADVVLGRISKNRNKNKEFEAFLGRIRDGEVAQHQQQMPSSPPPAAQQHISASAVVPQDGEVAQHQQQMPSTPPPAAQQHISASAVVPQEVVNPSPPCAAEVSVQLELSHLSTTPAEAEKSPSSKPSFLIPKLSLPMASSCSLGPLYSMTTKMFPVFDRETALYEASRQPGVRPPGRLMLRKNNSDVNCAVAILHCNSSAQTSPRKLMVDCSVGANNPSVCDSSTKTSPRLDRQTFSDSSSQTSPRLDHPLTLRELRNEVRELLKGMGF
jgi:hypothetical protein